MAHTHKPGTVLLVLATLAALAALVWPDPPPPTLEGAVAQPFTWDRAALFMALEADFAAARMGNADDIIAAIDEALAEVEAAEDPSDVFARLESLQFQLAATAAADPPTLPRLQETVHRVRVATLAALATRPAETSVRGGLYRVIHGGRAALEEALVQAGADTLPPLALIDEVPSRTPSAVIHGVRVHSGDIVLTRGGAPTSALIARGNNYPSHFSHAALVHVEEGGSASVIESLIEHGLVVSSLDDFLRDKKLRILLLRPRPTLAVLAADPMTPHRVASAWLARARDDHLDYDFAMDWENDSQVFCSEVVYHAYLEAGVELWRERSTISAPGLVSWLGVLGVRNFVTLVPSDLEYEPQLAPVAEWRDPDELRRGRRDNAIIDALLEEADRGATLGYTWYQLPAARALKAWSVVAGLFGGTSAIPRGMSGATAARVNGLRHQIFATLRAAVEEAEHTFRQEKGYQAPYWQLVPLARQAVAGHRDAMAPALSQPAPALIEQSTPE